MTTTSGGEQNIHSVNKYITYPIAKKIAPIFNAYDISPNMITSFNILLRIFILHNFITLKKNVVPLLFLSHFLDCLDGTIARMFDKTSKFGAQLDHISDKIFWSIMLLYILLVNCKKNIVLSNVLIVFISIILISQYLCYKKKCDPANFIDNNVEIFIIILSMISNKCLMNN